jgi:hypothetical protein
MYKIGSTKLGYLEIYNNFSKRIFPMPKGSKSPYNKLQFKLQHGMMLKTKDKDLTKDEFDLGFPEMSNAGIWAGEESGITILDLDIGVHNKQNPSMCNKQHIDLGALEDNCNCLLGKSYSGLSTLERHGLKELALNSAIVIESPSGGLHLYYKWSKEYEFPSLNWLTQTSCKHCGDYTSRIQGMDLRNTNKYLCLLPPSMNKVNGTWKQYKPLDTPLERGSLQVMPMELIKFLNEGFAERHTAKTHKAQRVESFVKTNLESDLDDVVDIEYEKHPFEMPKKKKNTDEIKYRKDRYVRRKAFTDEGKQLARFDNDLGLAVIGTNHFIKTLQQYAVANGIALDDKNGVDRLMRRTTKYLKKVRSQNYMIHPITKEMYHKVGRFFMFLDLRGVSDNNMRPPIPRKDFTLQDSITQKGLDKERLLAFDDLDKYMKS